MLEAQQMNRVREVREAKGISLSTLSTLARIAPGDLSLVERNMHPAYPAWRGRLAAALETAAGDLFPEMRGMTRLKQERLRRGWTQLDVAARTGIGPTVISNLESGKRKPGPLWGYRLSRLFDLSVETLLEEVPDD
jgi:transcriptional regulator with XRE-family HTH domain